MFNSLEIVSSQNLQNFFETILSFLNFVRYFRYILLILFIHDVPQIFISDNKNLHARSHTQNSALVLASFCCQ